MLYFLSCKEWTSPPPPKEYHLWTVNLLKRGNWFIMEYFVQWNAYLLCTTETWAVEHSSKLPWSMSRGREGVQQWAPESPVLRAFVACSPVQWAPEAMCSAERASLVSGGVESLCFLTLLRWGKGWVCEKRGFMRTELTDAISKNTGDGTEMGLPAALSFWTPSAVQ